MSGGDRDSIRQLLVKNGAQDSLGYFALRSDKNVIWSPSGKACVAYRVLSGVMLASGDPIGDPEAWPGAIHTFLDEASRHAWVPAVMGCSELGAQVWCREGDLTALELGDEAVVNVADFRLDGRAMRNVRQMNTRVCKEGYTAELRRVEDLTTEEIARINRQADTWRGSSIERGWSMALGRVGGEQDGRCVIATACQNGEMRALLHFVPWGDDGLSLDLMRRDRAAKPGLNDFMIVEAIKQAPQLGVKRISLNFAMFRAALERGERIGAGPVLRAWRRIADLPVAVVPDRVAVQVQRQVRAGLGAAVPGLPQHHGCPADRPGRAGGRGLRRLANRGSAALCPDAGSWPPAAPDPRSAGPPRAAAPADDRAPGGQPGSRARPGRPRWPHGRCGSARSGHESGLMASDASAPPSRARCLVMGVVNVTPDSFSDGGAWLDPHAAIEHGRELAAQGADIIDVGGESTRPGAERVPAEEELSRVLPVVTALAAQGCYVSIDTMRAEVATAALQAGARMVNDVSGGLADPQHGQGRRRRRGAVRHDALARAQLGYVRSGHLRGCGRRGPGRARRAGHRGHRPRCGPGAGHRRSRPRIRQAGRAQLEPAGQPAQIGCLPGYAAPFPVLVAASRKRFLGRLLAGPDGEPRSFAAVTTRRSRSPPWPRRRAPGASACTWCRATWTPCGWPTAGGRNRAGPPDEPDKITISGLRVRGRHGVFEYERVAGQEFLVDAVLWLDTSAGRRDRRSRPDRRLRGHREPARADRGGRAGGADRDAGGPARGGLPGRRGGPGGRDHRAQAAGASGLRPGIT